MKKLTQVEEKRRNAALTICKTLSEETSVVSKPLSKVDIKHIPNNVEADIRNWLRKYQAHEIYGSAAMATHSIHARVPNDLDIAVGNPKYVANSLASVMRSKGIKVKIVSNPMWSSYVIQVFKNGEYKDAVDIHPLNQHRGSYEFFGSSQAPVSKKKLNIQKSSDQLLRKFNAITQRQKDGSMSSSSHREIKDTTDAIQITELLLASMELKSKAQLAKAKQVKEELKVWKAHLRKLKGGKKKVTGKRKPLSATRQKKFVRKAVNKPGKDIGDLIFENGKVIERKVSLIKVPEAPEMVVVNPYYGAVQLHDSFKHTKKRRKQRKKKKASVPYNNALKTTHSFSKNIKKVGVKHKKRRKRKK